MNSKSFWKSSRKSNTPEPADPPKEATSSPAAAVLAPVNPFVRQLISQADSLNAVSSRVESEMKRDGIPVLAATRMFLHLTRDRVDAPPATHAEPPRGIPAMQGGVHAAEPVSRFHESGPIADMHRETMEEPAPPLGLRAFGTGMNPVAPKVDPPSPTPIPATLRQWNLDLTLPGLSHDTEFTSETGIDLPAVDEWDAPAIDADHVLSDWAEPKNFHGNDHAQPYDAAAKTPHAVTGITQADYDSSSTDTRRATISGIAASTDVVAPVQDKPVAWNPASARATESPEIVQALHNISDHYRQKVENNARNSEAAPVSDQGSIPAPSLVNPAAIPGQIATPYMVTVHGNLEIPKVPPYIWSAPEVPWEEAGQDPLASWSNCSGNQYQLSLDF